MQRCRWGQIGHLKHCRMLGQIGNRFLIAWQHLQLILITDMSQRGSTCNCYLSLCFMLVASWANSRYLLVKAYHSSQIKLPWVGQCHSSISPFVSMKMIQAFSNPQLDLTMVHAHSIGRAIIPLKGMLKALKRL